MQQSVLLHEERPVSSLSDCAGNGFAAEFDRAQFAVRETAPRGAVLQRPAEWLQRIARALVKMKGLEASFEPVGGHGIYQLSKGWAKSLHLPRGGRISCRTGRVWITLDKGGEDIVLSGSESKDFRPGARVLVEALDESQVSLEAR